MNSTAPVSFREQMMASGRPSAARPVTSYYILRNSAPPLGERRNQEYRRRVQDTNPEAAWRAAVWPDLIAGISNLSASQTPLPRLCFPRS